MMNPNFFGRCRECESRPNNGLDGLIGGICKRCWTQASERIRARFAGESEGELRYSFHGHPRPFHSRKRRNSASRAEHAPATDPGEGGRDVSQPAGEHPVAPTVQPAAVPGAGSSAAPACLPQGHHTLAEVEKAYARMNRFLGQKYPNLPPGATLQIPCNG